MSRRIRVPAPAKVNLTLEVLGRRPDGFHELASVMATVDLHDTVTGQTAATLDVHVHPDLGLGPNSDLAARAARALASATGKEPRARVDVRKRIPVAAGLGGGSSDAGSTLRALAALWRVEGADLVRIAAEVGSDVPFFAAGQPVAVVRGRGERVEALTVPPLELWITLVTLPVRLATAEVFAALDPKRTGSSERTDRLAAAFTSGEVSAPLIRELAQNDLLAPAERVCPRIAEVRAAAAAEGIELSIAGSGPSLFAIADDRGHAIRLGRALKRIGLRARPSQILVRS